MEHLLFKSPIVPCVSPSTQEAGLGTSLSPRKNLNCLRDTLKTARSTLREKFNDKNELNIEEVGDWVEVNIRPLVLDILANSPEIIPILESSGRLDIRLTDDPTIEDEQNSILMIIDRWRDQTVEDALMCSILNPSAINTHFSSIDLSHNQLIRLALSAKLGSLFALHNVGIWAFRNRPDNAGNRSHSKFSEQEKLFKYIISIYTKKTEDIDSYGLSDYQKRALLLCMQDFNPDFSTTTSNEFTSDLESHDCDSRLLYQIGTTANDTDNNLLKSRKKGFLKGKFEQTRLLQQKLARAQELQRFKREIEVSKKRAFDTDELEQTENKVNESIRQIENPKTRKLIKPFVKRNESELNKTAEALLKIVIK